MIFPLPFQSSHTSTIYIVERKSGIQMDINVDNLPVIDDIINDFWEESL